MLDRLLPDYLLTPRTIDGVLHDVATLTNSRVWRVRAPQASNNSVPYVVVGAGHDIDVGQTAGPDLTRELGSFNVLVCGDPTQGFAALDPIADSVMALLKACRQQYIPNDSASYKMWVQCILIEDREQFTGKDVTGNEQPLIGYIIPIRAGYDKPIRT